MFTTNEFLDKLCEETGMNKEDMRASTNRAQAKKVLSEISKLNGLSPEMFSEQFKELIQEINNYSSVGATRISYKYSQRLNLFTEKFEALSDETNTSEDTATPVEDVVVTPKRTKKSSPTDSVIMVKGGNNTAFEKCKNKTSVMSFKKLLDSSYATSLLKELGYKCEKQTIQSAKRQRLYDIMTIDWSENRK